MKGSVLSDDEVLRELEKFEIAELFTDRIKDPQDKKNAELLEHTFGGESLPLYLVLDASGRERARLATSQAGKQAFLEFLRRGQAGNN